MERLRHNSGGRGPRGLRGGFGRGPHGRAHAAADDGHDQDGGHVVQSRRGRRCEGADSARNRRFGRPYGAYLRPLDHPVPHAQPIERSGHVEPSRAVRQGAFLAPLAAGAGEHAQPLHLAGRRGGAALFCGFGRWASARRGASHPHGGGVRGPRRGAYQRNLPRRTHALRRMPRRGRQGGRRRVDGHHRIARGDGLRGGPHEDGHARAHRRTDDRFFGAGAAGGRRASVQIFVFS